MSIGWDKGGSRFNDSSSNRLICGTPPGGPRGIGVAGAAAEGTVLAPGTFKPNAFCGFGPIGIADPPVIDITVVDFSYEFWFIARYIGDNNPYDSRMAVGLISAGSLLPQCAVEFYQGSLDYRSYYDAVEGVVPARVRSPFLDFLVGWHHIAVNYDRVPGTMETFFDGVSADVTVIDALNGDTIMFSPGSMQGADWLNIRIENIDPSVLIGPIAFHRSILTDAQIRSSVRGKRVQMLGTTEINWDWRNIEGYTGWETDPDRISTLETRVNIPAIAPIGAAGTVVIPDMSGSGNDWILPTAEAYGTSMGAFGDPPADRAMVGFIVDPFWMN